MKIRILLAAFVIVSAFMTVSCTKDAARPDTSVEAFTDAKLLAMSQDTVNNSYVYLNAAGDSSFSTTSTSSGFHGSVFYKMRMNKKAFDACTAAGKLPAGGSFPDSSLIIKHISSVNNGPVSDYAVMYKLKGSWNWALYSVGGTVYHGIGASNSTCVSCHQPGSRDLVRTFDEHP